MLNVLSTMEEILNDISDFVNGCLGPLGGSGSWPTWIRDFLIQLCATILLFVVVRAFLWKPITNLLEAKKAAIDEELTKAETAKNEALELQQQLEAEQAASKVEIARLLEEAVKDGNARREDIIKEAKLEAERRITQAQEEIQYEIKKQENDIKHEIVEIAFIAAEKIIGQEVDRKKYLEVVNSIIDSGMANE